MRTTTEYLSLQLAFDPRRRDALVRPQNLTTARFESVYREMTGSGMLDLLFENDGELFVVHAVVIDVLRMVLREGPALVWPATLQLSGDVADELEAMLAPWLLSLSRGRGLAGEYIRAYRPSAAFALARERQFGGAVPAGVAITAMAPFVYARRFAWAREVYVACSQAELACAVIGTVAHGITRAGVGDEFAERWYGRPLQLGSELAAQVAIVNDLDDVIPGGADYIIATNTSAGARTIVVPIPVPYDHLFTFDPADAPVAASFVVRALDRPARPVRVGNTPAAVGGSQGRIALVVRDDGLAAPDADLDAVHELARRLSAEGLDPFIATAGEERIRTADIVHIFGGIGDEHIRVATAAARAGGTPFVVTVEPIAAYAKYYEQAGIAAIRSAFDAADRQHHLEMFHQSRIRFDDVPFELPAATVVELEGAFERACSGAAGIILAPGDDATGLRTRFPRLTAGIISAPVLLGAEPPEERIAELLPAGPFLLMHGPLTMRSAFGHVLAALGETSLSLVIAGPISEVDVALTYRRIGGSGVIWLPDPTAAQIAALYRRAHALIFPALRPTGPGRLIRAALCGALPLVPSISPLAQFVPPELRFDIMSRDATVDALHNALAMNGAPVIEPLARRLAPAADQHAAFRAIVDLYARSAAATPG